ncbi:MFS transporter [Deinococcus humi]|uniref:Sugar phosphate permease n=1 Tax=Deinococcus humi TaxID=662880 RepID=A0A7W8JWN6_9DEIO|nr:MFS transporter [Deinococcus humi]MBB5364580.1 sugar phosphate permease [Deinococcus humi]GGO38268.1 MFS transporter [Deinococcus humi]
MTPPDSAAPARSRVIAASPVYYGWVIVAAGTLGVIMTTPGQTVGVSAFLDPIIKELGLSRSLVSTLYLLGTLMGALAMSFVGRAIDRFGPRRIVTVVAALFALACVLMGFVRGPWTLLVGFVLLRGLGQGALGLVSAHVVNLWFVRRRGLALGLTGLGAALANGLFPPVIQALIEAHGWRSAYMMLGGLVAVTILPVGAMLFRDRPERYGLIPDSHSAPSGAPLPVEQALTLPQARRTPMFWLLIASGALQSALGTGLIFHHFSLLADAGVTRDTAALVFVPIAAVYATSNLLSGVFLDRFSPRRLIPASLVALTLALLAPLLIHDGPTALAYGGLLGLMQGMQSAVSVSAWGYYFGRTHLGAIRGLAFTTSVAGTAFGPLLFALGKDWTGSYASVLLVSALVPLLLAAVAWKTPVPAVNQDGT